MTILKKIFTCYLFAGLMFVGTSFSQTVKIGCVDLEEVFSQYDKVNEMRDDFKKDVEVEQKKVGELEANIRTMQADYEKKKDVMKAEEKSKKETELREKIQEFSKLWSEVNKKLDEKYKELEGLLLDEVRKEIKIYGEKHGFTVVLDSRMVLYGQDTIDLTDEIVKRINIACENSKK